MPRLNVLVMLTVLAVAGCGGGSSKDPPFTDNAKPTTTATPKRGADDARILIQPRGRSEVIYTEPIDPDRQQATLINRTGFAATLKASSATGGGVIDVPGHERRSLTWRRSRGPDRLKIAVKVPGHPGLNFKAADPIG